MSHLIEGFPRANQKATAEQKSLTRRFTILVLVCLLPCVSVVSCVGTVKSHICTTASDADGTANGEAVINPRIEVPQTGFQQANSIWIRDGESVIVEWDRVDLYVTKKMAECHFETLTSFTENCRKCDLCENANPDLCGFASPIMDPESVTYIPLKMRRGLTAEGEVILDERLVPSSACTIPRAITPSETSTIELYKPLAACDDNNAPPILSTPVHVIKTDHHESVKRELQKHEETKPSGCGTVGNPPCQTVWYRTIPNDPVWSHYFSEQVKIGPVRISKYKKDQSGRLTFIEKVRPSRIVIISNFQGTSALDLSGNLAHDGNRCYAIPEAQITGDQPYIDFSECHTSSPDDLSGFSNTRDITATPNYFADLDDMTDNNAPTWFIEFNDVGSEASPPPSLGADEFLFIEFEIIPQ